MKVILQRDVARLGKRHTVVTVPDGYALNKLLPQGLAVPATPEALKRIMTVAKEVSAHQAIAESELLQTIDTINSAGGLTLTAASNTQGHLFKAIHPVDVATAALAAGYKLPAELIVITKTIKSTGAHSIMVRVGTKTVAVTLTIIAT